MIIGLIYLLLSLGLIFVVFLARTAAAREAERARLEKVREVFTHTLCLTCAGHAVLTRIPRPDDLPDGPVVCATCGHDFGVSLDAEARQALADVAWQVEVGELVCVSRSDDDTFKQYLTKTEDKFRPPYRRREGS